MKLLVFLGSVRNSAPPAPPRLGMRIALACMEHLQMHHPDHQAQLIDPLDYTPDIIFKPHFAYAPGKAPADLEALAKAIAEADGYVMVSPEYNHSMSPALAHLLNHFGSSLFAYKPSLIVTYSAGQWGGTRAAAGMRPFLSELGCLPVSAMLHIPKAQEVFTETGTVLPSQNGQRWAEYFHRGFSQLTWWAEAANVQRKSADPHQLIGDFTHSPSQRNAP